MKRLPLGLAAVALLMMTATAFAQNGSPSGLRCGALQRTCAAGTQPACVGTEWQCTAKSEKNSQTSSSSSVRGDACGPNNVRCMSGTVPVCTSGAWHCQPTGSSSSSASSCIAMCPDGYRYRTCTEDGHPINYFADPCMNHYGSSSSRSSSSAGAQSCGPNTILCCIGTSPLCTSGRWTCIPRGSSSSSQASIRITSMTPSSGPAGTQVTIEGTGFAKTGNVVRFAKSSIGGLRSADGTHLTFRVPATRLYVPGRYNVSVKVRNAVSNTLMFTITGNPRE